MTKRRTLRPERPEDKKSGFTLVGEPSDLIKLRDLPGVAALEAALHVPGWHLLKEHDGLEERIIALSKQLFGITPDETEIEAGPDDWEVHDTPTTMGRLTREAQERHELWELPFDFLDYEYDEEAEVFWTAFGWDVTDGNGNELAIMEYFGRPLTCITKRLHTKARFMLSKDPIPPASNADLQGEAEAWGASLAEDARRYKPPR